MPRDERADYPQIKDTEYQGRPRMRRSFSQRALSLGTQERTLFGWLRCEDHGDRALVFIADDEGRPRSRVLEARLIPMHLNQKGQIYEWAFDFEDAHQVHHPWYHQGDTIRLLWSVENLRRFGGPEHMDGLPRIVVNRRIRPH